MKASDFRPRHLNVVEFTVNGETQSGTEPLQTFARLCTGLHSPALVEQALPVQWTVSGEVRRQHGSTEHWLHLQAQATVPLECQRCLEALPTALSIDRLFMFVGSEDQAAELDADSEADVLVLSRNFDLLSLIEDELVMALPLIPLHEVCPIPVKLSAGEAELAAAEQDAPRENPFAALADWRKPAPKD